MKYIVRAIKYWLYISVIMSLILMILSMAGLIPKNINDIFDEGWVSVLKIEAMFLIVSAIYPRLGYTRANAEVPGEFDAVKDEVVKFMDKKDYELEKTEGENISFRRKSVAAQLARVWEDRLSFERTLGGWTVEGKAKDVVRIANALSHKFGR